MDMPDYTCAYSDVFVPRYESNGLYILDDEKSREKDLSGLRKLKKKNKQCRREKENMVVGERVSEPRQKLVDFNVADWDNRPAEFRPDVSNKKSQLFPESLYEKEKFLGTNTKEFLHVLYMILFIIYIILVTLLLIATRKQIKISKKLYKKYKQSGEIK